MNNRKLVRSLEKQGFRVTKTGKHFRCYPCDRSLPFIVFPSTPSDNRGMKNCISYLKKIGYKQESL